MKIQKAQEGTSLWNKLKTSVSQNVIQPISKFLDERNPSSPNYIGNISDTQRAVNQKARDREIRIVNGEEKPTIVDAFFNGLSDGFGVGIWSQGPIKSKKTLYGHHHSPFSTKVDLDIAKGKKKTLDYILSDDWLNGATVNDAAKRTQQINSLTQAHVFNFPMSSNVGGFHLNNYPLQFVEWLPEKIRNLKFPNVVVMNPRQKLLPMKEAATHEFFHAASQGGKNLHKGQYHHFYQGPWKVKDDIIDKFNISQKDFNKIKDYLDGEELWATVMTDKAYGGNTFNGNQILQAFGPEQTKAMMDIGGKSILDFQPKIGGIIL